MADETLQAFQLGASLYDRAQTQKRMMEQFNLQLADQAMRKEHYDIQNKIATDNAKRTLDEQNAFNQDLPLIQDWQAQFLRWNAAGKPNEPFPAPPTNLKSATGLKMLGDMSGPVLQSLPMMRNQALGRTAYEKEMESLNNEIKFLTENGKSDVVLKYNRGINPETNQIDLNARDEIFNAAKPLREQESKLKRLAAVGLAGQRTTKEGLKNLLESGEIDQAEYNRLLPTARTEGGVVAQRAEKALDGLKKQGIVQNDSDETNAMTFLMGANQGRVPADILKSLNASNGAVVELDDAFRKLNAFENKYGKGSFSEYVGPLDAPIFDLKGRFAGLTSKEQEDARDIHTKIKLVVTDYQNNKYGATLTPSEENNLKKIVSSPSRNDYMQVISAFNSNLRSGAENKIWDFRFSPDIPYDLKKRYLEGARQKFEFGQTAQPKPVAPSSKGIKIESVEVIP
jgi:hypothetical protein